MKKLLSIIVPCYNSEDYMEHCIESLLIGGEAVEILLVNDGSKDGTRSIADHYQEKYPTIVKTIHQENGGHGQAINSGLLAATGLYLKVVDSDDWVDEGAYRKILTFLDEHQKENLMDMIISNYVYEKQGVKHKKVMEYRSILPIEEVFNWSDVHFPIGKYLLMHSVIYRTELLKDIGLKLPKHTFYVDNLYVFQPLPLVKKMYYLDVDFYRYYIGREDQSVNEAIMISRIDQQIFVNKELIRYFSTLDHSDEHLTLYMRRFLEIITAVSSILLLKEGSHENLVKKEELWNYIEQENPELYGKLRRGAFGHALHLPGKLGRKTAVRIYQTAQKIYGFN
ncbi:glycosyltransferase family 2 protein [Vagococcus sp.]|uniref:glycosyltransferase family 2 protein n=1 Tax=Vagococcus sp. TaxID=1933889 RepID=UPI003F9EA5BE